MAHSESDTRAKLMDPALHPRGWTEDLENPQVFQTQEVISAGGLEALKAIGKPNEVLLETK